MSTKKKNILFIINPRSGVGKQKIAENEINKHLDFDIFNADIVYTQYAHHATALSKEAVGKYHIVVAVGGDGSINDVVNGLHGSNVTLAIIPAGSGNGLARHLKIPLSIPKAIALINKQEIECIDTIKLNDNVYASIAGIGFDALVAREMAKANIRGLQAYTRIVLQNYMFYRSQNYSLIIDGKQIEREALFICFANSNQFGYNTTIAPTAELNDGLIDICIVKKIPYHYIPATASLLFSKNFQRSNFVETFKASHVSVLNNETGLVNVDGESLMLGKKLEFEIIHKSLNVITMPIVSTRVNTYPLLNTLIGKIDSLIGNYK